MIILHTRMKMLSDTYHQIISYFTFKREPKIPTLCEKCGTYDCLSEKEYQSHITISGPGIIGVSSTAILQSCRGRQQINALEQLSKRIKSRKSTR